MDIFGKNIMILGKGVSGKAAIEALNGIAKRVWFYEGEDCSADIIITSPGIATHSIFDYAIRHNIPVISELELGFILNKTPVIAITGTNGKTTVTRLIGDILSKKFKTAVCGNIGLPFSAIVHGDHEIAVVEASSFQLERCYQFKPQIAVITNITEDHLDRHGTMQNYIDIKMSISKNQTADDYFIIPTDLIKHLLKNNQTFTFESNTAHNKYSHLTTQKTTPKVILSDKSAYRNCGFLEYNGEKIISLSSIKIEGEHNKQNIMQAMIVAKLMGIENEDIEAAVSEFEMDRHRCELVSEKGGKRWYDDSKATNIDACVKACESMKGTSALILGGSDKGENYEELFRRLPKGIKVVFLMGEVKDKLRAASGESRFDVLCVGVEDLSEAVRLSGDLIVDNVLLSPAAASFDRYKDYKERGEEFRKRINLSLL